MNDLTRGRGHGSHTTATTPRGAGAGAGRGAPASKQQTGGTQPPQWGGGGERSGLLANSFCFVSTCFVVFCGVLRCFVFCGCFAGVL